MTSGISIQNHGKIGQFIEDAVVIGCGTFVSQSKEITKFGSGPADAVAYSAITYFPAKATYFGVSGILKEYMPGSVARTIGVISGMAAAGVIGYNLLNSRDILNDNPIHSKVAEEAIFRTIGTTLLMWPARAVARKVVYKACEIYSRVMTKPKGRLEREEEGDISHLSHRTLQEALGEESDSDQELEIVSKTPKVVERKVRKSRAEITIEE